MSINLEADLVKNILNLQNKIQEKIGGALSEHGIGLSEYFVLNQLYLTKNQKTRLSDLADHMRLSPSGITRLLIPMEKIGLIEKENSPLDARVSLIALSENGKKRTEETKASLKYSSITLFELLDKKHLSVFAEILKVITK